MYFNILFMWMGLVELLLFCVTAAQLCDNFWTGYQCNPSISYHWGQYSPWFAVPSEISPDVPHRCQVTFAQVLSRHGARDPTAAKTASYNTTINGLKANVTSYTGVYSFLANYTYTLGADQLTTFGQQEMVNSGIKFYARYRSLTKQSTPFVRAASEARVVQSAQNWTQGYHKARLLDRSNTGNDTYPYGILIISEADGSNNTLNHGLCTTFEDGPDSKIANSAQTVFAKTFVPAITARLNADLPGAKLKDSHTISLMDLCPFNTVASPSGQISPFCALFTSAEWHSYNYYQSLNKFYGYGNGNPLGPTQGVGWTNELIARLTSTPVQDHTSVNHTLDNNPVTFPIADGHVLFADFSHDNDMTAIYSALGLYNRTLLLSNTTIQETNITQGYSAAWTVPFAARMYVEKLRCSWNSEELVRILVNDRVIPLVNCGADNYGMCSLTKFVDSLSFARAGGLWDQCFS